MWELDYKESWVPKNSCFRTVVLEKTLESPWTARRSNQSVLKEIIGKTEAETAILWPPDEKNWQLKRPWCLERLKAGGEGDEVVGWHHRLNGHESEQALRVGDGQGSLVCCCPWGRKESDMTERLNWTDWRKVCWTSWWFSGYDSSRTGSELRSLVGKLRSCMPCSATSK